MNRLIALLRRQNPAYEIVPRDWQRALPQNAPLLAAASWREILSVPSEALPAPAAALLCEVVDVLALGLKQAAEIGERLLCGRSLAIWRKRCVLSPLK